MTSSCPGCGGLFPEIEGPTHGYMTSSPGCWRAFGEVLAADYSDPARMAFHQVVVDAYAAQHPGDGGRQAVQSVGLHLMTLCLFLEHEVDPARGTALHQQMIGPPAFRPLERSGPGHVTVAAMPTADEVEVARAAAFSWGESVWSTYAAEHDTVRQRLRECQVLPA